MSKLKKYNFSQAVIDSDIAKKYDDEYILNTLLHCENYFKQSRVVNKEGFILKALEKEFYIEEIDKQNQQLQSSANQEAEESTKESIERKHTEYLKSITQKEKDNLTADQLELLKKEFLDMIDGKSFFKTAFAAYGFDHTIIQSQRNIYLKNKLLSEEQRSVEAFLKIHHDLNANVN